MATLLPKDLDHAESAPVIAEQVAIVDGTPDEVWAVILDYPGWADWFPGVQRCEATSDPATGVGSTRRVTLGGGIVVDERFLAWDEPTCWAFTALTGPPGFESLVERVTLHQIGPRLTEVTYRMAIGPKRPLTPLFRLLRPVIEKNLRVALRNLNATVVAARA
jgi:carbon monoxide dehydrogenase subunit G